MTPRNAVRTLFRAAMTVGTLVTVTACKDLPTSVPDFGMNVPPSGASPAFVGTTYKSTGKFSTTYYGNWCGSFWSGGTTGKESPIDRLDTACQTHDGAYGTADAYWGQQYRAATTRTARASACTSWRLNYFNANNALASAAYNLPGRSALEKSVTSMEKPDVWGYDSRIFGPHPRSAYQRVTFRDGLVAVRVTGLFKDPPCSLI